jgi:hypothetical protein
MRGKAKRTLAGTPTAELPMAFIMPAASPPSSDIRLMPATPVWRCKEGTRLLVRGGIGSRPGRLA